VPQTSLAVKRKYGEATKRVRRSGLVSFKQMPLKRLFLVHAHRLTVDILWHRARYRHRLTPRWVFPSIHAVRAREVAADEDFTLFRIYGRILPSGDEGLDHVDLVAVTVVLKRSTADNRETRSLLAHLIDRGRGVQPAIVDAASATLTAETNKLKTLIVRLRSVT
jgi:hypothetical protein